LTGVHTLTPGQLSVADFQYTLDNVGNRTAMTTGEGAYSFGYDLTYRLTHAGYPGGRSVDYTYDPVGNRVEVTDASVATNYVTDDMNRILTVNATSFAYDVRGNLAFDGVNTYHYDLENHLVQADVGVNHVYYKYDPLGRLFARTDGQGTTYYLHAGDQIAAHYSGTGTLVARFVYGTGIDEPLLMVRGSQTYYYSRDGLGSVVALTNAAGNTVESYSYDAYGKPNVMSALGNPYLFTGRQYDSTTGIYYYRARWYSPGVGRWMGKDPIGFAGGDVNLYGYVSNGPVNWMDPSGLESCSNDSGWFENMRSRQILIWRAILFGEWSSLGKDLVKQFRETSRMGPIDFALAFSGEGMSIKSLSTSQLARLLNVERAGIHPIKAAILSAIGEANPEILRKVGVNPNFAVTKAGEIVLAGTGPFKGVSQPTGLFFEWFRR
jgi:RHS repeat-associated protein